MEHYIYLDKQDKIKITKQAQSKQLSLSTLVNIIAKNYFIFVNNENTENYIKKGKARIKIKPRNENKLNYTDKNLTNVIYLYLHQDAIKQIYKQEFNLTKLNRKIQSECDKTLDNQWNLNNIIRQNYIANKKLGVI